MFCVLIKVLWLTSPTGTSKRLVCFILGCFSRICHVDCKLFVLYSVRVGSCQALRLTAFVLVVSGSSALLVFLSYVLLWFFTVV